MINCYDELPISVVLIAFCVLFSFQIFHLASLDKYFDNPEIRPIKKYRNSFKEPFRPAPYKFNSLSSLTLRLQAYARLSNFSISNCDESTSEHCVVLDDKAHKILLGTLKKIEAKNAALISLAAILVAVVAIVAGQHSYEKLPQMQLLFACLGLLSVMPVYQLFRGIKQVDQYDFYFQVKFDSSSICQAMKALQLGLMYDLLTKERCFRFAKFWVGLISLILILVVAVDFALPALCASREA